jgi:hypothetical protein
MALQASANTCNSRGCRSPSERLDQLQQQCSGPLPAATPAVVCGSKLTGAPVDSSSCSLSAHVLLTLRACTGSWVHQAARHGCTGNLLCHGSKISYTIQHA